MDSNGRTIHRTAVVDPAASLGAQTTVGALAVVSEGVVLADGCTVGASAVLMAGVQVAPGTEIGAAAVIHQSLSIGAKATIRPGAVVTRNVPAGAVVEGHPARIIGYAGAPTAVATPRFAPPVGDRVVKLAVEGVTLHRMQEVRDLRGGMTVGEFERAVPFAARRYYVIYDVPTAEVRGEHAHRACHGFLVCVHGACSVVVDDGERREEVLLNSPDLGLYRPPMTWSTQYKYTRDAVLLVFASHYYDPDDYIRDYEDYLRQIRALRASRP